MKSAWLIFFVIPVVMLGCAPDKFGSLSIQSTPAGASVSIDGSATGQKTDCVVESLAVGEHTILLSLTDYIDYYDTVNVVADETVLVSAALTQVPVYGAVEVNSTPTGAAIYLDGVNTNHLTDYLLTDVLVGSHIIKLTKSGYVDHEDTVDVAEDDTSEVSSVLTPATGAIRVNSKPIGAEVWLDTADTYKTTNCVVTNVPIGAHTVKLIKTDYDTYTTTVTVAEHETTDVSATLVKVYGIFGSCNTPGFAYEAVVSGNYAYVADGDAGLVVVDLADRSQPTIVGTCNVTGIATGLAVAGSYAYVAVSNSKLAVVNVTTPSQPSVIATCNLSGTPNAVYTSGNYAYVASGNSGIQIVNIATPSSPQLTSSYVTAGPAKAVFVSGNSVYAAAGSAGIEVIDVSLPWNPVLVDRYDTPGEACGIFIAGSYTYVADGAAGLQIWAASDSGNYDTPDYVSGVYGLGSYAYLVDRSSGLVIVDASAVSTPERVGRCDTPGLAQRLWFAGSYVYIADGEAGLAIIKL